MFAGIFWGYIEGFLFWYLGNIRQIHMYVSIYNIQIMSRISRCIAPLLLLGNPQLILFVLHAIPSLPHSTTTLLSLPFLPFPTLYFPFLPFSCPFICNLQQGGKKQVLFLKKGGVSKHGDPPFYLFPSLSSSSYTFLPFPAFSSHLMDGRTDTFYILGYICMVQLIS